MKESTEIRKLFISLKEKEKEFGSISPKVVLVREKIKKQIVEIQLKINELRRKEGKSLNREK
jgi:hypothetical protein